MCEGLAWAGIALDPVANTAAHGDARIGAAASTIDTWVIAADEERMIARQTRAALAATAG